MADITQQVTSQTPFASPIQKNPKRVQAGILAAEKRRQAREEQDKKIAEAEAIMAKEELRKVEEKVRKAEAVAVVDPPVAVERPPVAVEAPPAESNLSTARWLSIASIVVSLVAIYYKREEIRGAIAKIKAKDHTPIAPANLTTPKKKSIRPMD